jgi:hypothetical protein
MTDTRTVDLASPEAASGEFAPGMPPEQVNAWLEHLQADMRRVRSRLEYLRAEQTRLESQRHLLAELLGSSTPV